MTTALAPFLLFSLAVTSARPMQEDDPTVPDARVRAAGAATRSVDLAAPQSPPALPVCTLRSLVVARGKSGAALIECNGALYRAESGIVLLVEAGPGRVQELRVTAITRDEVRLEFAADGRVFVLR